MLTEIYSGPEGLPTVDQTMPDGSVEKRLLAAFPTPSDHPLKSAPGWEAATGISVIQRQDFKDFLFERRHTEVPIINQGQRGKCVCSATKAAISLARARSGAPYIDLSDDFLYTLCNDGRDRGTYAGRAVAAAQKFGLPRASLIKGMPLGPPGYSKEAIADALRFRLRPGDEGFIPINTIEEAFTAVASLYVLLFDVQAGGRYNTNADGVVSFLGRMNNHEQSAGEGLRIGKDGRVQFLGRNSWDVSWGMQGFGWYTEDHMNTSDTVVAVKWMYEDTAETDIPPLVIV